ncbi:MAG: class SAM-dependent methyltransferase [Frankiales bacterium]|nr:class SAM-dependent methyltransferase [Frankiales bacterium]
MTATTTAPAPDAGSARIDAPDLPTQAGVLLPQLAGYVGHRTIAIGLRSGMLQRLADAPDGLSGDDLAKQAGYDAFYVDVWCRAALGAGVLDRTDDGGYRLAPHMATLLLDTGSPAYVGGVFTVLEQYEMFGRFEESLASGERMWWDDCGAGFIDGVSGTGRPFYTRLIPGGLQQVPGLVDRLDGGARVLDTACGAGAGLLRLAATYPNVSLVGVDGDEHSLELARQRLDAAGVGDRVELVHSPLETMSFDGQFDVVINNISMHECRDRDAVTANVRDALKAGGWFVISDFPFPGDDAGLRTVPGRIMSGIQFFEAQIDDQLLPRTVYDDLLAAHGFTGIGSFVLTPMHAVTYGVRD